MYVPSHGPGKGSPAVAGKLLLTTCVNSAGQQGALFLQRLLVDLAADPCSDFLIQNEPVLSQLTVGELFPLWAAKKDLGGIFDLAPDGKRFVVGQDEGSDQTAPAHVNFLLNFADELQRRAPSRK